MAKRRGRFSKADNEPEVDLPESGEPEFLSGGPRPGQPQPEPHPGETQAERLRRRAAFLRDLAEAKELRERVSPRRTRVARLREALRRATYRNP